jgi:hypothetical protein
MVANNKPALKAIQRLLIHGRMMSFDGLAGKKLEGQVLFEFFDHLEYLPGLLLEDKDTSVRFKEYLARICQQYNCYQIYLEYDKTIQS